ncbi:MAG: lecithin retinol acyltransferase family protein [Clostridia bacterium]|nr:lecithin retinol acyltransferase family protein [Clostridia bacterium]
MVPRVGGRIAIPRREKEQLRRLIRKGERKAERMAEQISPRLGKAARKTFHLRDRMEDTVQRLEDTATNAKEAVRPVAWLRSCFQSEQIPPRAAHIKVLRAGYSHHGIYFGDGKVIHSYKGEVRIDPVEKFSKGNKVLTLPNRESPAHYSEQEIVDRALRRQGENRYNLIFNNCEHFARWCRCGD